MAVHLRLLIAMALLSLGATLQPTTAPAIDRKTLDEAMRKLDERQRERAAAATQPAALAKNHRDWDDFLAALAVVLQTSEQAQSAMAAKTASVEMLDAADSAMTTISERLPTPSSPDGMRAGREAIANIKAIQVAIRNYKATIEQAASLQRVLEYKADMGTLQQHETAVYHMEAERLVASAESNARGLRSSNSNFSVRYNRWQSEFGSKPDGRDATLVTGGETQQAVTKLKIGTIVGSTGGATTSPVEMSVDLLQTLNIPQDVIREQWRLEEGVLAPAGWTDDHGPWIQVPASPQAGYLLRIGVTLMKPSEALYVRVPLGDKWGLLVIGHDEQDFNDIRGFGQLVGHQQLPIGKQSSVEFRFSPDALQAQLALSVDGRESIHWKGSPADLADGGEVWSTGDTTCFALGTKSARVSSCTVEGQSSTIVLRRPKSKLVSN